jgi:Zn-dependent M28 family amino/carboxypeptidase
MIGSDSVYNGADDNAAGVAAALEAARVLASGPPPAAPVAFAFFSGTEQALLGSSYYVEHPLIPLNRIAVAVNVEAIGRNLRDSLAVVEAPRSGLPPVVGGLRPGAAAFGLTLVSDPWPSRRLWLQGDHGRFHQLGVPVLYLFNGQHGDLHRPGDESRKVAFDSVARVARFLSMLARHLTTEIPPPKGAAP